MSDANLIPIDDLDTAIVDLATRINAETYELLVLVRQFDERCGWLKWGFENCVDWLHWRCDLSVSASREKVRVANALKTLPEISAAFCSGELSYSKVRALTRVARTDNESELVDLALRTTAARVEEFCRELRCGSPASTVSAERVYANRSLRLRRDAERNLMTMTVELPMESGELLAKAIDKARDDDCSYAPELGDVPWSARQADALVTIANNFLSGDGASSGTSDNYQVTVHVDQSSLQQGVGRSGLPLESVKRLCCDGNAVVLVENETGEPLSVGHRTRTVPTAIKRALKARDKGCVFPGCRHERFVDAHHVQHWSAGGETSLGNLMLLCSRHHRLVHEGGFSIQRDYKDCWFFKRADGRPVPAVGYHRADVVDEEISEVNNYPSAEVLLSGVDNFVKERPPPAYYH